MLLSSPEIAGFATPSASAKLLDAALPVSFVIDMVAAGPLLQDLGRVSASNTPHGLLETGSWPANYAYQDGGDQDWQQPGGRRGAGASAEQAVQAQTPLASSQGAHKVFIAVRWRTRILDPK